MSIKFKGHTIAQDGFSPIIKVSEIEGGHRVTITDITGMQTFDVMNGEGGSTTTLPVKAPVGCIVWWSGTITNIPTGWHICDGEEGTIDLRDKFILAAGTNHAIGDTGGSEEVTLSIEQMPRHNHSIRVNKNQSFGGYSIPSASSSSSPDLADSQTVLGQTGSSEPHPNMPPYYTLCAIQKIAADEEGAPNVAFDDTMTTDEDGAISIANPNRGIMTQAEYDALSENEKAKGTYIISDNQNGSDEVLSNTSTYSTEETVIGTWIDGKPLYRKTFAFTTPSSPQTAYKVPNCSVSTNAQVVNAYGGISCQWSDTGVIDFYPGPNYVTKGLYKYTMMISGGDLYITIDSDAGSAFLNRSGYFTVEYTKLTD